MHGLDCTLDQEKGIRVSDERCNAQCVQEGRHGGETH